MGFLVISPALLSGVSGGIRVSECSLGFNVSAFTDGSPDALQNPCYIGTHGCDTNAACRPGPGTQFTCECSIGFRGDGQTCYGTAVRSDLVVVGSGVGGCGNRSCTAEGRGRGSTGEINTGGHAELLKPHAQCSLRDVRGPGPSFTWSDALTLSSRVEFIRPHSTSRREYMGLKEGQVSAVYNTHNMTTPATYPGIVVLGASQTLTDLIQQL